MWVLFIAHLVLLPLIVPASSSMVFELQGDVYPTGHFYVTMSIGDPAKTYFLDIDTGSMLTWLECDVPGKSCHKVPHQLYRPKPSNKVVCEDERCVATHRDLGIRHDCTEDPNQCDYEVRYAGGESSMGALLADKFSLPINGDLPTLAFGCGYDQQGGQQVSPVDGVLGIGRGTADMVSQLKQQGIITENVVGHCLGIRGGGFLFFGADRVPSSGVTWVPMLQNAPIYYSPGTVTLNLNVQLKYPLSAKPMMAVFDSGSTYTYVPAETYAQLIHAVGVTLSSSSLTEVADPALSRCWQDKEPIKSVHDVKMEFEPLEMVFAGRGSDQATMEIPPENYLVVTERGNVCMGILNGTEIGLGELNLIGDVTMQDQIVIYDNERARIGWVRAPCDSMPGPEPVITSRL